MQKELMEIIFSPEIYSLQSHDHLNLHFCFPTKQWIPAPGAFISLRMLPQPADKGCQCNGSLHSPEENGNTNAWLFGSLAREKGNRTPSSIYGPSGVSPLWLLYEDTLFSVTPRNNPGTAQAQVEKV